MDAVYLDKACSPVLAIRNVEFHRIILDRPARLRPLYWRVLAFDGKLVQGPWPATGGGLSIAQGATVSFDTYFNGLFEYHWRLYTQAGAFRSQPFVGRLRPSRLYLFLRK